jgi:hypothetical protein
MVLNPSVVSIPETVGVINVVAILTEKVVCQGQSNTVKLSVCSAEAEEYYMYIVIFE